MEGYGPSLQGYGCHAALACGQRKTAQEILESLTQFASETPEKGVWFDNLTSSFGNASTLQTTTAVLGLLLRYSRKTKSSTAFANGSS